MSHSSKNRILVVIWIRDRQRLSELDARVGSRTVLTLAQLWTEALGRYGCSAELPTARLEDRFMRGVIDAAATGGVVAEIDGPYWSWAARARGRQYSTAQLLVAGLSLRAAAAGIPIELLEFGPEAKAELLNRRVRVRVADLMAAAADPAARTVLDTTSMDITLEHALRLVARRLTVGEGGADQQPPLIRTREGPKRLEHALLYSAARLLKGAGLTMRAETVGGRRYEILLGLGAPRKICELEPGFDELRFAGRRFLVVRGPGFASVYEERALRWYRLDGRDAVIAADSSHKGVGRIAVITEDGGSLDPQIEKVIVGATGLAPSR